MQSEPSILTKEIEIFPPRQGREHESLGSTFTPMTSTYRVKAEVGKWGGGELGKRSQTINIFESLKLN